MNSLKIKSLVLTLIFALGNLVIVAQSNIQLGKTIKYSGLKFTDIGSKTKAGKKEINKEVINITASGADVWGRHDECNFAFKTISGNFDISVQVLGLSKTHLYTKAGIMARVNLDDSCQHVYFQIFPDNSARNNNKGGCEFQYRKNPGEEMKAIYPNQETAGNQFDVKFPDTWIRLKRTGDVFESYFSNDNQSWKLYSTFTLKLPEELLVGLAVTSHDAENYTVVQFKSLMLNK